MMSYIDEVSQEIPAEQREVIKTVLEKVWNNAIERAADVAERGYYDDDHGFEPMAPSTIADRIRKLAKTG